MTWTAELVLFWVIRELLAWGFWLRLGSLVCLVKGSAYNFLSAWSCAFEVGYCHVGIVDLQPCWEGFCGEAGGVAEGSEGGLGLREFRECPGCPGPWAQAEHY